MKLIDKMLEQSYYLPIKKQHKTEKILMTDNAGKRICSLLVNKMNIC